MLVLVAWLVHVEVKFVVEDVVAVDVVEVVVPVVGDEDVVGGDDGRWMCSKRVVVLGVGGVVECVFPVVDG